MKITIIALILVIAGQAAWFYDREQRHVESFRLMQQSALGFFSAYRDCASDTHIGLEVQR